MLSVENDRSRLILADCLDALREMPDSSIDSIVTDPPYGLTSARPGGRSPATKGGVMRGFMGLQWDGSVPSVEVWAECLRVLKPGGYLLAFAGTRTQHRMAVRIEDAGFEIRDMIAWVYGSGFPKSMDVSKAIDKAAGAEREVLGTVDPRGTFDGRERKSAAVNTNWRGAEGRDDVRDLSQKQITASATDAARQWQGWGTALKPALEPITVARKPLIGTVAANVLAHGTGALNIDGCRVDAPDGVPLFGNGRREAVSAYADGLGCDGRTGEVSTTGRFPANLIHDGSDEVLAAFPQAPGQIAKAAEGGDRRKDQNTYGAMTRGPNGAPPRADAGSAARFFYCAKASRKDREDGNNHPTVKPTELMRYLCRLVTPPGGAVLDPYMGSGSTGKAAMLEGFRFIGIEKGRESFDIATARIKRAQEGAAAEIGPQSDLFAAEQVA